MADRARCAAVLSEVAALVDDGWRFVLCHGGGPQASELGARLGLEAIKVAGQRVTDAATLDVVCQVLAGQVACRVVSMAHASGLRAVGLSAGIVHASRRPPVPVASEGGRIVDYGLVGDVTAIDRASIEALWSVDRTPVLNPIGVVTAGEGLLNINADTVAAAVATALQADHLFAMTAVAGVLRDRDQPETRIPSLDPAAARAAIADGTVTGGMIPKVEEALVALERGVGAVHIVGPQPGALAAEAACGGSRGTVIRSAVR